MSNTTPEAAVEKLTKSAQALLDEQF